MTTPRRALLVGIDDYDACPSLEGCVADVVEMEKLLERHYDGTPNYDCNCLASNQGDVTRARLREVWKRLFQDFRGDILFYFAGHGSPTYCGGFLGTTDATESEPGLPMDELLNLANTSHAREVLLVLDCCSAGFLGNPPNLQSAAGTEQAQLREGVSILAAARPKQEAVESEGHGLFTWLVLNALRGGAADVRGRVSAASVYAYVEQVLGPWDQRPLYKSHANTLSPIRCCEPAVPDSILRNIPTHFPAADSQYQLDPSYERTAPSANQERVKFYRELTILRDARLLKTVGGRDLYDTAMASGAVQLTPLGQLYWLLATKRRI